MIIIIRIKMSLIIMIKIIYYNNYYNTFYL